MMAKACMCCEFRDSAMQSRQYEVRLLAVFLHMAESLRSLYKCAESCGMLCRRYGNWEYHYVGLPVFGSYGGGWGGYGSNYWCNSYYPGDP